MTKRQKIAYLERAAELIETGKEEYSCHAIDLALYNNRIIFSSPSTLRRQYGDFYGLDCTESWRSFAAYAADFNMRWKSIRVLLLLFYAEAIRIGAD